MKWTKVSGLSVSVSVGLASLDSLTAQSHPCDTPAPTAYRESHVSLPKLKLGFCFAPFDTAGEPLTEPVGFSMQINEGPEIDLGMPVPLTAPNANGEQYYEIEVGAALMPGIITLKAYTATLGMSASSDPISLRIGGPKP